jgi:hypothetical protein
MPTYRIIAKYQPNVDHVLFGRFLNLVTSPRLKWTHDCNPDGTGHIYKITVYERQRPVEREANDLMAAFFPQEQKATA